MRKRHPFTDKLRIPLLAALLPFAFLCLEIARGNPLNPWDFLFLWLSGMAMVMFNLLLKIRKQIKLNEEIQKH